MFYSVVDLQNKSYLHKRDIFSILLVAPLKTLLSGSRRAFWWAPSYFKWQSLNNLVYLSILPLIHHLGQKQQHASSPHRHRSARPGRCLHPHAIPIRESRGPEAQHPDLWDHLLCIAAVQYGDCQGTRTIPDVRRLANQSGGKLEELNRPKRPESITDRRGSRGYFALE